MEGLDQKWINHWATSKWKQRKKNMNPHSGESVEMSKTHPNVDGM